MRVRRGLLFWGLVLIPLGVIPLLARAGVIDPSPLADAWRWWPLVLVAVGIALVVGRTRASLVGVVVVALAIGTIGGAALANGRGFIESISDCGGNTPLQTLHQTNRFDGPARVELNLSCGEIDFATVTTDAWTVDAGYRDAVTVISSSNTSLSVRAPSGSRSRQEWTIRVPASFLHELAIGANAGSTAVDLDGAKLARLTGDLNAGDLRIDAGSATVDAVNLEMNAGRLRLTLASAATSGELSVNAGAIDVCVPDGVGLRLDVKEQLTFANNLAERGLAKNGTIWTRAGTTGTTIDLRVEGNAAAFNLNPSGGCA
jgi:hypothetical protein